ncbi:MAG: HlyD family efflux transporter periplasmic adaptor subunit [Saprospiraceae bacterium]|nr:HlyD family efflux transporter periplasmic adaptor subunit [Saprospiraceae bacterium]
MLNISPTSIKEHIIDKEFTALVMLNKRSVSSVLLKIIYTVCIIGFFTLFLPWTQNIRSFGYVTTLNPDDKPQAVQSLIEGRIKTWFVREGDIVNAGDTIAIITESKEEYLDPQLLDNTQGQIVAKGASAEAYKQKIINLDDQLTALIQNKDAKLEQNEIKIRQSRLKIKTDSMELIAARIKEQNTFNQYVRTDTLYSKGIRSLTELEIKKLSYQEAQAKVVQLENKIDTERQEITNLIANRRAITSELNDKIAKTKSEQNSALSSQMDTEATVDKLTSEYNKYKTRSDNYVLRSPIDGIVTQVMETGIGEMIKAGEDILSIIPINYDLAVETYVRPRDMPLLRKGQKVRILFDGWPAIVFSGWPDNSYGTFGGKIFAIDNFISDNGRYRILIAPDPEEAPWPSEVRIGGGANTLILLNEVKIYYEIWRLLNGFPPDYYQDDKEKNLKPKAPIRRVEKLN